MNRDSAILDLIANLFAQMAQAEERIQELEAKLNGETAHLNGGTDKEKSADFAKAGG